MTGIGSAQLRLYVAARRAGATHEAARDGCGMAREEARLTDIAWQRGELEDVGPPLNLNPSHVRAHVHVREDAPSAAGEQTMFQDDKTGDTGGGQSASNEASVSSSCGQLRAYISRVERLQDEIDGLNEDKADVFKEAKSSGFDTNIMKQVIKRRKLGAGAVKEAEDLLHLYEDAMVRQIELPLSRAEVSPVAGSGRRKSSLN